MKKKRSYALFAAFLTLNGCATFRSYNSETQTLVSSIATGQVDQAITEHEAKTGSDKDLLYFMEKGELQRLKKLYPETIATWTEADQIIAQWESEAKISGAKVGQAVGSVVVNDKLRRYDGEDYEKVMLSTRLALACLAAGKTEDALVEIKKTWERENLIKTLHEKDIDEAENTAKEKGYKTKSEDLKGYPIATLNSPDVTNLKNGYQNAFSHYLSGFLYEAAGEESLAAASYRTAIELQPSLGVLKDGLMGMDNRFAKPAIPAVAQQEKPTLPVTKASTKKSKKKGKKGKSVQQIAAAPISAPVPVQTSPFIAPSNESDVLFVVETGVAPFKKSIMIPLPIPYAGVVPISFPVLETNPISANKAASITLPNNSTMQLTTITSIENLSRRSLKDNLPSIMVRAAIRGAVKGASQAAVYRQSLLAGLVVNAVNVATEQADERTWGLLPAEITIARVKLPEGKSTIKIQTSQGMKEVTVNVSGKHVVIPIRLIGNSIYNLQANL
ncbi:hypothetical protein LBMAG43_15820 [Methylococcaceae bacterium]|nr:hypothetical protein LBMAG43_15820 [Methylococcaceae bacterium]